MTSAAPVAGGFVRGVDPERASRLAFFGVSALLFAISAAVTVVWCASMQAMGGMPMPGGWTMAMAWMRMPGESWPGAAASFLGMWTTMMVAMMLPSLVPMLWRYRQRLRGGGEKRIGLLAAVAAVAYFVVWSAIGLAVYPLGATLATIEMRQAALAPAVPIATGIVVLMAGMFQFSGQKTRALAACQQPLGRGRVLPATVGTAWRDGLHLGLRCLSSCAGLMAILVVLGVMDVRVMAVVTAAITLERVASAPARAARIVGAVTIGAGALVIVRAAGLG